MEKSSRSGLVLLLGLSVAVVPQVFAQVSVQEKINPKLRNMARQNTVLPVLIVLANQPHREILDRIEGASQLRIAAVEGEYRRALAEPLVSNEALRQAHDALDTVLLAVRRAEFAEIEAAIEPDQSAVEANLLSLGATNVRRYSAISMIGADIPATALDALEAAPSISVVFPAETHQAYIDISAPALGAPAFWSLGYTGVGQSAAILDTGVRTSHPAFTGANFNNNVFLAYGSTSTCFADNASTSDDIVGHGTHIAGIITSRGQSGGHESYLGVAKGLGTVYVMKIGYQSKSTPPCSGSAVSDTRDLMAALNWAIINAPSLKVFNYSFGGTASGDDDGSAQMLDNLVDLYGLTIAVAAGNSGSSGFTVASPGIAYNIISVASMDDNATLTRSDDGIASYSSRGPTAGSRYKPDIAAPGSSDGIGIISTGLNNDWVSKQGTSMATPHIAASAALLRNAGVSSALVAKAILLNSTDNNGWQADRGWGSANLATASQQLNYLTGSIAAASQPGHFAYYKGAAAANFRATLVWNRHISGSISNFNNLDLYLYDSAAGGLIGSSTSTLQNVEQVTAAGAANTVLKVATPSSSFNGVATEPFAIALSAGGFTSASGPALSINCSAPATVTAPAPFQLSCTATNNGGLPAFGATGTVTLPAGFSGSTALSFGTVQPGTSSPASTTLTPAGAGGFYNLSVAAGSVSFGETLTASWNTSIGVYGAVAVTIATTPSGLAVVVDGSALPSPQVLNWIGGSTHTIGVASPQANGGTRYVFAAWSDGGAQTHTVTLPIAPPAYTASLTATQYLLSASASPAAGGNVTANPSSPDGYYAIGASVQLTAAGAAGYQFSQWSGDLTGAVNPQSVPMSAPRNVTANFISMTGITISTNPPGLAIVVDGSAMIAPRSFNWAQGTSHSIGVASPQGSAGVRYVFANWSDGGAQTHSIVVSSSATAYTANFSTQYLLSASVSPTAGGTVTANPSSADGYYNSGSSVQLTAAASSGYQFGGWSGDLTGSANPQALTMNGPRAASANFSLVSVVTVATNPLLAIVVDGASLTAPQSFNWVVGSSHSISVASPQTTGGTRYVFANWSDGGAQTHSITVPSAAATYTAAFNTQYLLTAQASPAAGGTVTANPGSPDGYYSSGASVQLTAVAGSGYQFANWSGDLTGSANPQSVTMSGPRGITANFSAVTGITIATNPAGLSIVVDGGTLTAPQSFLWAPGSQHSIGVTSPQGSGGTSYPFNSWTDGGAATHQIAVGSSAAAYTASFDTQYQLTVSASPAAGGSVSPTSGTFYNPGAVVSIGAIANSGSFYSFTNWTGSVASASSASTTVTMSAPQIVTANFSAYTTAGLLFYPVTPCRIADTRGNGFTGAFGPPTMQAGATHSFAIPQSNCNIPASAQAYSLNVTAVPAGQLTYLTVWPAGQPISAYSTLNDFSTQVATPGNVASNAAIVPAGPNGAVSVYVSDASDVIIDVNGYFAPPAAGGLAFYPVTPCRVADTRGNGKTGSFGPPSMAGGSNRGFPIPQSSCNVPSTAQAYSLNMTVAPPGQLTYLTAWPAGQPQPTVSTLNVFSTQNPAQALGKVVANAAIVRAGTNGSVSVFVSDATDVIIDINGYFAAPDRSGALAFYTATPCRVADTRGNGFTGAFGPPAMAANATRTFPVSTSSCGILTSAQAYSLNMTVAPPGQLTYLTAWPTGQAQPTVSTLNDFSTGTAIPGRVVANAAIVPADTNGSVSVFASDATDVIIDINGYFAP